MNKINVPNQLSIFRIILTIPIIVLLLCIYKNYHWITMINYNFHNTASLLFFISGILFVIASATDWLDGYLARRNNQITTLGKVLDPIADKILINSVFIIFAVLRLVPVWIVILMVVRDITVNALRIMLANKNVVLAADKWGKIKTVSQILGLLVIFFIFPLHQNFHLGVFSMTKPNEWIWYFNILIIISLICSYISGAKYLKQTIKILDKK